MAEVALSRGARMADQHFHEDQRPVIEFNHHSREYRDHWREVSRDNLTRCPVAWTEEHGGFWLVSGYAPLTQAIRDDAAFSSYHDPTGDVNGYQGIMIPPFPRYPIPIELDPPEFFTYRRLLNPHFSPESSKNWEPYVRATTADILDRVCAAGEMDLVLDLANPVPASVTLKLLGLPLDDWAEFAATIHEMTYTTPGTAEFARAATGMGRITETVRRTVDERRVEPADDLISHLVRATVDGAPVDDDRLHSMITLVLAGGVDTTTSLLANALYWLHRHPRQRQRLIDDPALIPTAADEFLRYFAPVQMLARTATRDVVLGGQEIRAGERVMLSFAAANQDPEVFSDPDTLDLARFPNRHVAFGAGIHRCLGAHLARVEFCVILEEVLARIPDYQVDESAAKRYPSIAAANGYITMPATFTPSRPGRIPHPGKSEI
ncbi:cytochrome P450 [Herbidospora sp. NEAU-GS84]|uniref:Cytochrome P450 n=1 Tax=Herbidospora solisilvae TaxID=2696284 RepID=A0A7C9NAN5_9ACTN|nr:cytochrome P450 [Herbidospora solisilvae]NAS25953.1 cytochrome P450 [Herbidospora solisilvae]